MSECTGYEFYEGSGLLSPSQWIGEQSFRGEKFFDKPLEVTQQEAAGIMKFVDAMKAGIYIKCRGCGRFKIAEMIHFRSGESVCDRCA